MTATPDPADIAPDIAIVPIAQVTAASIDALLDRAFGPDRHGRTAYRIRDGMAAIEALSFAAIDGAGALVGSIQCWPVAWHGDDGRQVPLVMVGPVAVEPALQRGGIGRVLTGQALAAADAGQFPPQMLIGDPEYYGRFFGFDAQATGDWRVPGPIERHRLLARGADAPHGPGLIGPRRPSAD